MISLKKGDHQSLIIQPRWPSKQVLVDASTLNRLLKAQSELPEEIKLVLTRAYEPKFSSLGTIRKYSRCVGVFIFQTIYPNRKEDIGEIFGSNGHDVDGTHVDVSFTVRDQRVKLLPLSVFTPLFLQDWKVNKYREELSLVKEILIKNGFKIHDNKTESLQIHCDFL